MRVQLSLIVSALHYNGPFILNCINLQYSFIRVMQIHLLHAFKLARVLP